MYKQMVDVLVLKELVKRAESKYTCKRGPRPSGALLHIKSTKILGDNQTSSEWANPEW